MTLTPINVNVDISTYPAEVQPLLYGAELYDSSCSTDARVIFIDKDCGYFLKSAPKGALEREAIMTRYFHAKGLAANVLAYLTTQSYESGGRDWLLTVKVRGDDGVAAKYLEQPERLCDIFAERLAILHSTDYTDCPIMNHTELYIEDVKQRYHTGNYDHERIAKKGYATAEEAFRIVESCGHLLRTDTLLHGDYCLPNIIFDDWRFSGFIDLDLGGVGDRHRDLFAAMTTFRLNFKTDEYNKRFFDAYGRDKIDEDLMRIVAAAEVFG